MFNVRCDPPLFWQVKNNVVILFMRACQISHKFIYPSIRMFAAHKIDLFFFSVLNRWLRGTADSIPVSVVLVVGRWSCDSHTIDFTSNCHHVVNASAIHSAFHQRLCAINHVSMLSCHKPTIISKNCPLYCSASILCSKPFQRRRTICNYVTRTLLRRLSTARIIKNRNEKSRNHSTTLA